MIITVNNACKDCLRNFADDHKYCGYCGITLTKKSVNVPVSIWKIIIDYITDNKTIIQLSLVNSELFNATYCENSTILRKIYGKLIDLDEYNRIFNQIYCEKFSDNYYEFFNLFRKYEENFRIVMKRLEYEVSKKHRSNPNIKYLSSSNLEMIKSGIDDGLENIFDKMYKDLSVETEIKYSEYMFYYDSNISTLFEYYLIISKYLYIIPFAHERHIFYYLPPYNECKNCLKRKYNYSYYCAYEGLSKKIDYCDDCLNKLATNCYICGQEITKYKLSDKYRQIFGEVYICGYVADKGTFTQSQKNCMQRAINKILKS